MFFYMVCQDNPPGFIDAHAVEEPVDIGTAVSVDGLRDVGLVGGHAGAEFLQAQPGIELPFFFFQLPHNVEVQLVQLPVFAGFLRGSFRLHHRCHGLKGLLLVQQKKGLHVAPQPLIDCIFSFGGWCCQKPPLGQSLFDFLKKSNSD